MTKHPLISIITPVLNAEKYIRECAESVFAQSWDNWEWIVVDNGCTDRSMDIIREFSSEKITILKESELGVSRARNKALQNMNGKFFCFLDADDSLPEFSLESRVKILLENPEISFADGAVSIKNETLQNTISNYCPSFEGEPLDELTSIRESCFFGNTWMIRREEDVDYSFNPDLKHSEDLLFYISICKDKKYGFTEDEILHCRRGHQSAMQDLVGIEKGYRQVVQALSKLSFITEQQKHNFQQKAKSIMLKTWLKKGNIGQFISVLFKGL